MKPGDIKYALSDAQLPPDHRELSAKLSAACSGHLLPTAINCLINALVAVAFNARSGLEDQVVEWVAHAVEINRASRNGVKQ